MNKTINASPLDLQVSTDLLSDLRSIIGGGKLEAASAVNHALTLTYWQVGKRINDEVLQGERAAYGKQLVAAAPCGAVWSKF
jgi:hypothetical protein